jgi:alpha-amylase
MLSSLRSRPLLALLLLLSFVSSSFAALAEDWRKQSIYQIIVDRFNRPDDSYTAPCNTTAELYCGGTWQGVINKLDYVQGMGFTAIWISPVVMNINETTPYGQAYHGFWTQDIYQLNPHFGTANDLRALSDEVHKRGMYLMVDVVTNDYAYPGAGAKVDYSTFNPLNSEEYFHKFCWISDYEDATNAEQCWLGDNNVALADVDTENPTVQNIYNEWVRDLVGNYSIDGLRIDAAKHVNKPFWLSFTEAAGVFTIGEMDDQNITWACSFMDDALSSILNYPIYTPMIESFNSKDAAMFPVFGAFTNVTDNCTDSTVLGTFTENQDVPRFPSITPDMELAKNIIAFSMLSDGIPMIYNGVEQHFNGTNDPHNREALWLSGFDQNATLYEYITMLNKVRNNYVKVVENVTNYSDYWKFKSTLNYADEKTLSVCKGVENYQIVSVLQNRGEGGATQAPLELGGTQFVEGEPLIEVFSCNSTTVGIYGTFNVTMTNGEPQVCLSLFQPLNGGYSCRLNTNNPFRSGLLLRLLATPISALKRSSP